MALVPTKKMAFGTQYYLSVFTIVLMSSCPVMGPQVWKGNNLAGNYDVIATLESDSHLDCIRSCNARSNCDVVGIVKYTPTETVCELGESITNLTKGKEEIMMTFKRIDEVNEVEPVVGSMNSGIRSSGDPDINRGVHLNERIANTVPNTTIKKGGSNGKMTHADTQKKNFPQTATLRRGNNVKKNRRTLTGNENLLMNEGDNQPNPLTPSVVRTAVKHHSNSIPGTLKKGSLISNSLQNRNAGVLTQNPSNTKLGMLKRNRKANRPENLLQKQRGTKLNNSGLGRHKLQSSGNTRPKIFDKATSQRQKQRGTKTKIQTKPATEKEKHFDEPNWDVFRKINGRFNSERERHHDIQASAKTAPKNLDNANSQRQLRRKKKQESWSPGTPKPISRSQQDTCSCKDDTYNLNQRQQLFKIYKNTKTLNYELFVYLPETQEMKSLNASVGSVACKQVAITGCTVFFCESPHRLVSRCLHGKATKILDISQRTFKEVLVDPESKLILYSLQKHPSFDLMSITTNGHVKRSITRIRAKVNQMAVDTKDKTLFWSVLKNKFIYWINYIKHDSEVHKRDVLEHTKVHFDVCSLLRSIVWCETTGTYNYLKSLDRSTNKSKVKHLDTACRNTVCFNRKIYIDSGKYLDVYDKSLLPTGRSIQILKSRKGNVCPWCSKFVKG